MKKFSIRFTLSIVVGFLIAASALSVFFALTEEDIFPLALVAVASVVAVMSLTFLITRGIMQPLGQIRKTIQKVGEGNFSTHVELKTTREMEEMGQAFNNMIWKLHAAREEAKDANKILEHRVRLRTQQLREFATSLEEKVEARTKELQEKIDQMERFQKLAVGRELKMIELKEKLKAGGAPQEKRQ